MINTPFDEESYAKATTYVSSRPDFQVSSASTVDWRSNGVSAVKDQGSCGSCWAFATTAAAESYFMIKTSTTLDLSEEYVL